MLNNRRQNTQYKALQSTIRLSMVLFLALFLVGNVSSFEWDNVKSYDAQTKIATITNAFDFPLISSTIAEVQLKSELEVQVGLGYQKVFEYEIISYKDYSNFIQELEVYNLKSNLKENKQIDLKYLDYENVLVDDYKQVCKELFDEKNGTSYSDCYDEKIGSHTEQKEIWKDIIDYNLKVETKRISGWTNVKQGDYYEWIPSFAGIKVNEWATWSGNLSTNLLSYYNFDEISGTTAHDSIGTRNATNTNVFVGMNGIINKGYTFNGSSNKVLYGDLNLTGQFTISAWYYRNSSMVWDTGYNFIYSKGTDGLENYELMIYNNTGIIEACVTWSTSSRKCTLNNGTTPILNNKWIHTVQRFNGTVWSLWINGTQVASNSSYSGQTPVASAILGAIGFDNAWGNPTGAFRGMIDEVGFWSRALTNEEIAYLYNSGSGCAYGDEGCFLRDTAPTVTLTSPTAFENFSSNDMTFDCKASDDGFNGGYLQNITYYLNDTAIETNSSVYNDTSTKFYDTIADGYYKWNCGACDNAPLCANGTARYFTIDSTLPTILVTGGNGTIGYQNFATNHTLNYTIVDEHLDSCWIEYNGTNRTIPCTNGSINSTNFTIQLGLYNATLWANDTSGNTFSRFVDWNYNILFLNQTYESPIYETQKTNFTNNFIYNSSASIVVKLNYGGTNYSTTNYGSGSNGIYSVSFEAPIVNTETNKSFYWIYTYNNTTTTYLSEINQTILPITLVLCNGTYTNKTLNFTFINENTGTTIPSATGITFKSSYKYWLGSGAIYKNYSYQLINSMTTNNFSFCINPANKTFYMDLDLEYEAEGFTERILTIRNESRTNITRNVSLYLLPTTDTTKFTIRIKSGTTLFTGATTDVQKYFVGEGIYKSVMIGLTDDVGEFIANLEIDKNYNFSISKSGVTYPAIVKQASCLASPCEIDLNIGDIAISPFDDFYDYFAQNIDYNLTYNTSSDMVNLTFIDNLGTANYWRLQVYRINNSNDTSTTICDETIYSISGYVECNYSAYDGEIIAKAYMSRDTEKLVAFINFVNESITQILGNAGLLASIIIILVVVFAGIRNPVNVMVLIPFVLTILKFIGLLPLSWAWIVSIAVFDIWIIKRLKS